MRIVAQGFSEALAHIDEYDPSGRLGDVIEEILEKALAHFRARTPVVTGSMRAAWRARMLSPLEGSVFIDPSAVNSRSGVPVLSYAPTIGEKYGLLESFQAGDELGRAFDGF